MIKFLVDWDNDGDFNEPNEDISADVIRADWRLGFQEPYQHVAGETRLRLIMRNTEQNYSPEYPFGVHYGNLVPKRLVKVLYDVNGGISLYVGYIESISPAPGVHGSLDCEIVCVGIKQFLEQQEYYSPFFENVTADEVISDILQNTSLPVNFNQYLIIGQPGQNLIGTHWISGGNDIGNLETGITTFDYVGDTWDDGVRAIQAIVDLVHSERGWAFNDRDGDFVFWNRHHLILNDTVQGTLDNTWAEMDYRYGMDDIKNVIRVANYPRTLGSASDDVLYSLDRSRRVYAGGTVTFRARYRDQNSDAQVSGRNVTAPNTADGSLVTSPSGAGHTLTVLESDARSMRIEVVNTGNHDFDITTLQIKGQKVTAYNREEYEAINPNSVAVYGRQVMELDYRLLDNANLAQTIADYELSQREIPRGVVRSVTLKPRTDVHQKMIAELTIGDWIRVVDDQTHHEDDYIIMGEEHEWRGGQVPETGFHQVRWILQRAYEKKYIVIGLDGKNLIGGGRYIAP